MDEEEKKKTPTEYSSCITHRERTEERNWLLGEGTDIA